MAIGIFRNLTLAQLQQLHTDAAAALLAGKNRIVAEAQSGDAMSRKEWQIDNEKFWDELNYALELKGGAEPPVRRTSIRYV